MLELIAYWVLISLNTLIAAVGVYSLAAILISLYGGYLYRRVHGNGKRCINPHATYTFEKVYVSLAKEYRRGLSLKTFKYYVLMWEKLGFPMKTKAGNRPDWEEFYYIMPWVCSGLWWVGMGIAIAETGEGLLELVHQFTITILPVVMWPVLIIGSMVTVDGVIIRSIKAFIKWRGKLARLNELTKQKEEAKDV